MPGGRTDEGTGPRPQHSRSGAEIAQAALDAAVLASLAPTSVALEL